MLEFVICDVSIITRLLNRLIDHYGPFAVERLNIRGMLRNQRLAKAISDVGWYNFRMILAHKAESAGAVVIEVNILQERRGFVRTVASKFGRNFPNAALVRMWLLGSSGR
jgi:IS605 OrfB family transposase